MKKQITAIIICLPWLVGQLPSMAGQNIEIPLGEKLQIRSAEHIVYGTILQMDSSITGKTISEKYNIGIEGQKFFGKGDGIMLDNVFISLQLNQQWKGHFPDSIVTIWLSSNSWDLLKFMKISRHIGLGKKIIAMISKDSITKSNTIIWSRVYGVISDSVILYHHDVDWSKIIYDPPVPLHEYRDAINGIIQDSTLVPRHPNGNGGRP